MMYRGILSKFYGFDKFLKGVLLWVCSEQNDVSASPIR